MPVCFNPTTGAGGAMEDDSTKEETSLPGWTRFRNERLEWHPKVSVLLVPHSPAGRVQTRKGPWGQWKWQTCPTPRVWERGEERNETSMRTEEKLLSNRKTALLKLISFAHPTCIVSVICVYKYNLVSFWIWRQLLLTLIERKSKRQPTCCRAGEMASIFRIRRILLHQRYFPSRGLQR